MILVGTTYVRSLRANPLTKLYFFHHYIINFTLPKCNTDHDLYDWKSALGY
jgi:hypothetical protein